MAHLLSSDRVDRPTSRRRQMRPERTTAGQADLIRQARKAEAIDLVSPNAVHDLNNLLQAVVSRLDLIKCRAEQGRASEISALVERAHIALDRAESTMRQHLSLLKAQQDSFRPVSSRNAKTAACPRGGITMPREAFSSVAG